MREREREKELKAKGGVIELFIGTRKERASISGWL